jgi:hypothetical protein
VFYLQLGRVYILKIVEGQFRVDKVESSSIIVVVSKPSPFGGVVFGCGGAHNNSICVIYEYLLCRG